VGPRSAGRRRHRGNRRRSDGRERRLAADVARGLVVVNPASSVAVTASLGGTYVKSDGSRVVAIVLPPRSGLVLHRP
jgi:hypothetical protein